jgi:two-component system, sporulation sensor kinase B
MDQVIERILNTTDRILNQGERLANPSFERCCLKDVLNACIEQLKRSFSMPAEIQTPGDAVTARVFIHVDRELIQAAFINIIRNAFHAVKLVEHPRVEVHIAEIPDENAVRIVIEDNGFGMSEEEIQLIHDGQFSRDGRKGWGVRISKRILQMHNGLLEYKSQISQGTRVLITLSLAPME